MEKYIIETIEDTDYIVSIEKGFTIKVIPPKKRKEENYTPYQVVNAVFEHESSEDEFYKALMELSDVEPGADKLDKPTIYDFEGLDITYADDDLPECNKAVWLEAINFYCERQLSKTVILLRPYDYQYELSELNCEPETLAYLSATDEEKRLPKEIWQSMYANGTTSYQLSRERLKMMDVDFTDF